MNNITWQACHHSRKEVRRAVEQLIINKLSLEQKQQAFKTLANFRSAHAYPIQSMIGFFRNKAFEIDKNAIVVRRLKRIPSILSKLKRFEGMQVDRMGDIGGVRVIVKEMEQVEQLRNKILKGRSRNVLLREDDYLKTPKDSGYRSIHLTFAYQGSKAEYHNYKVELQIRSHIQHAWATAVEVVGAFKQQALKASLGDKQWLDFFKVVSQSFERLEKKEPLSKSFQSSIRRWCDEMNVYSTLKAYSVFSSQVVDDLKQGTTYLLRLDMNDHIITYQRYDNRLLQVAHNDYRVWELEYAEEPSKDVVLVSSESIKNLKLAYPNYFADTKFFLKTLDKVLA